MRTRVSIPDPVFQEAERLAAASGISRSQLYALALKQYLVRPAPNTLTEAMNRVCDQIDDTSDPFVSRAAEAILRRTEW